MPQARNALPTSIRVRGVRERKELFFWGGWVLDLWMIGGRVGGGDELEDEHFYSWVERGGRGIVGEWRSENLRRASPVVCGAEMRCR